ncbi:MAG: cyclic nucleotide-binding/CBS domain-containing protein [Rhodobacteraceae bacterium]|nr:MAG: cyclic nucleotide-binding/CBS domain-containing protein [Paracoccaceae bacterium]
MAPDMPSTREFLQSVHPYDALAPERLAWVADAVETRVLATGAEIYGLDEALPGLFLIVSGEVTVSDPNGIQVSVLGPRNSFGERGLLREGRSVTSARASRETHLLMLPLAIFERLMRDERAFARYFDRARPQRATGLDLAELRVSDLMAREPLSCAPETTVQQAAAMLREARVSSIGVVEDGRLAGILTTRDFTTKVLAEGLAADTPVSQVMTRDPHALGVNDLGSDVLQLMLERKIGHVPVTESGQFRGIITQTDLTRHQALGSAFVISDIAHAEAVSDLAGFTRLIPQVLAQLVATGKPHDVVTRLITDIADAVTRRLLKMAEARLGPPPVPYLWLACGSQGRREQTGVSDQDNCLFLHDDYRPEHAPYFEQLATFVSDGLDAAGYFYCPGDMMATNPRWRQPVSVWRSYFRGWVATPDPTAQMLASVMFDLRPIAGDDTLFAELDVETLKLASQNSIFVSHMVVNSLKHVPPLGLLRGFATIRSGENKDTIDLKHNGVVPVVDLGRIYALQGRLQPTNTRARLLAAKERKVISATGARDLIDAYDLIAQTRLEHQAHQIKTGRSPDNFMAPSSLSDFERGHLRDAFVVVRTMQSAIGHGRGALG